MKYLRLFCFLLTAILLHPAGQSSAQSQTRVPKADTQSWNDVQFTVPLNQNFDLLIQGTVRIGGNLTTVVDGRWGFGFNYKVWKYVTLNESYLHREAKPPNGRQEEEDRLTFGPTLRVPIKKFTLFDRNWFERRWRSPQVDAWRYRNRIQIEHPFKIRKATFTFLVSDEMFYDWSLHDWVRNRFAVGARHAFNKHFTADLYVMRQNDGRARPGDINIIGTVMRFRM
jgi:Protein of unknown function (DUF2490)